MNSPIGEDPRRQPLSEYRFAGTLESFLEYAGKSETFLVACVQAQDLDIGFKRMRYEGSKSTSILADDLTKVCICKRTRVRMQSLTDGTVVQYHSDNEDTCKGAFRNIENPR